MPCMAAATATRMPMLLSPTMLRILWRTTAIIIEYNHCHPVERFDKEGFVHCTYKLSFVAELQKTLFFARKMLD